MLNLVPTSTPLVPGRSQQGVRLVCEVCGSGDYGSSTDVASIQSNVRRWSHVMTTVWRCHCCSSMNALERRDLSPFYVDYPYGRRRLDRFTRHAFASYLKRLQRHGLNVSNSILDYGCGDGLLLEYLRERGYQDCDGYDPYSPKYRQPQALGRTYDVVICQDVIEHVEDPRELMLQLTGLVRPGGLLCIGTPRSDGIDLTKPLSSIHSLHAPFHLHVLSEVALVALAHELGLTREQVYLRHSCDSPVPFVNWPFLRAYLKSLDDTLDAGFETPRLGVVAKSPMLWFLGLFGYLMPSNSEMIAVFRTSTDPLERSRRLRSSHSSG